MARRLRLDSGPGALQHGNLRPNRHALVQIDDMFVQHADTTIGNCAANGVGLRRAMDTELRVFAILEQIQRARAKRAAEAAGHTTAEGLIHFRLRAQHVSCGCPTGPFTL